MKEINEKLDKNTCVIHLVFELFPTFLVKLSDAWQQIDTFGEPIDTIIATMNFNIKGEDKKILYVFSDLPLDESKINEIVKPKKESILKRLVRRLGLCK